MKRAEPKRTSHDWGEMLTWQDSRNGRYYAAVRLAGRCYFSEAVEGLSRIAAVMGAMQAARIEEPELPFMTRDELIAS